MTLRKLATNNDYRSIAHLFGISKASVCCFVKDVSQAIVDILMPHYIKVPEGDHLKETIAMFKRKWGFPQCAGAIDGSHIPIIAPEEYHTDYFNRKGWHSIILQGIVGPCYRFWDINVGWPGSVHDARVFANTDICRIRFAVPQLEKENQECRHSCCPCGGSCLSIATVADETIRGYRSAYKRASSL